MQQEDVNKNREEYDRAPILSYIFDIVEVSGNDFIPSKNYYKINEKP